MTAESQTNPPGLQDAIRVALDAHRGQKDRHDASFVLHPMRVMNRLARDLDRTVAVLHDVVEDTAMSLDDLRARGFSKQILAAVDHLTPRPGELRRLHQPLQSQSHRPAGEDRRPGGQHGPAPVRGGETGDLDRLNRCLRAWRCLNGAG